jgi:Fe-S-cluster-containing hydrogenase component 2
MNYIGPGGYFGEIGLLGEMGESLGVDTPNVRVATCSALDHVDLVRMEKATFLELLTMFPKVRAHFVAAARQRIQENEQRRTQTDDPWMGDFLDQGLMNAGNVLVLDLERCTRCDECTRACADGHQGVTRLIREGLRFDKYLVASSCRSCYDPYCLIGCPTSAIKRTGVGNIDIDKDACIGCGKCAENCPYGNINMVGFDTEEADPAHSGRQIAVRRQKATTCDKCADLGGIPRCVYACPHEAAERMSGSQLLELVKQRNSRG